MADVTITVDVDSSGAARGASSAVRSLDRVGRAAQDLGRKTDRAADSGRDFATELERLEKAGALVGGPLGRAASSIAAFRELTSKGINSTAKFALGVGGLAAALGALAVTVGTTIRDIDELSESLEGRDRRALDTHITKLQAARDAYTGLDGAVAKLRITMASAFADQVVNFERGLTYVVDRTATAIAYLATGENIAAPAAPPDDAGIAGIEFGAPAAGEITFGRAEGDGARRLAATTEVEARRVSIIEQAERAIATIRTRSGQEQIDAIVKQRALEEQAVIDSERRKQEAQAEAHRKRLEQIEEEARRKVEAERQALAATQQITSITAGFFSDLVSKQTAETKEERLRQFRAQKAIALAETAISGTVAIAQGFKQLGPIGGAVAAIAMAATIGGLIADITRQNPVLHTGGILAPDEMRMVVTARDNERAGVFSAEAQDRLGAQGMQDVTRYGTVRGDLMGGAAPSYLVLDVRSMRPARQAARPDPSFGKARR